MNWSDERYVRLYNRDTTDWKMWPWQSRALFPLLLRAVDRAGVHALGKHGVRGLAIHVGLPLEVVEPGLAGLLDDGCVIQKGDALIIKSFIEAQEAKQSDRQRQTESRLTRRERAAAGLGDEQPVTKRDEPSRNVTDCHDQSHDVTGGHDASQDVTLSLAVPCLAVPKEELSSGKPDTRPASESDDDASDDDPPALPFAAPAVAKPSPTEDAITAVLTDWQARSGMAKAAIVGPKARKRRTRIRQRLAEGYTPDELRQVVSGMLRDGFLMGTDPKSKPGGYRDVATVFRDSEQCDRLIGLAEDGTIAAPSRPADSGGRILRIDPPKPVNPRTPETDEAVRRMMAEFRAASVEASNG
jgi:hypothetical protein